MKTKISVLLLTMLTLIACNDFLDKPQQTSYVDDTYWSSEVNLRMYAQEFYPYFFRGYGTGAADYAPRTGYTFNDDMVYDGTQSDFELSVPASRGTDAATYTDKLGEKTDAANWMSSYNGPSWQFMWIRKANIMLDRMDERMGTVLNQEQKEHWTGIARFFRAMEYARLVSMFGDIPYYEHDISSTDFDELYKSRTPRDTVMDKVYNDLLYAMQHVRANDGDQMVNRDVVAAFASRLLLFEGTWQKYHYGKNDRAQKFLSAAVESADMIRLSGKYLFETDFRSLFSSKNLSGNKECILYRHYDAAAGVMHNVATACNLVEVQKLNPNASLLKAFICIDGLAPEESEITDATKMDLPNLIKTRDSRLEGSIYSEPYASANGSLLYAVKFLSREAESYKGGSALPLEYKAVNNVTDYPVMRYAEVLLNWIEAKAELSTLGGEAVAQEDIDLSINKIRSRPLAKEAEAKGVKKTAAMQLSKLPYDRNRDGTVSQLLWEIRRERRMEFAFEHSRLLDLKRWKKIDYMDTEKHSDLMVGAWVDLTQASLANLLVGGVKVINASGSEITYNGTNKSQMIGYYKGKNTVDRKPFLDVPGVNVYLAPVGNNLRSQYKAAGARMGKPYELTQTEGWSAILP